MLLVDLKPLVTRLNDYCREALEQAASQCVTMEQYEITVEHFLLKLTEDRQSDLGLLLQHHEVNIGLLQRHLQRCIEGMRSGNAARPGFSPLLLTLLQDAWLISSVNWQEQRIRSATVLQAFLARVHYFASGDDYPQQLQGLARDAQTQSLQAICQSSMETPAAAHWGTGSPAEQTADGESAIARYCENFTEKARAGKIDPVFGRDAEIRQMVDILARRRKNNPICVGEPGVGKTAVVEGLALRIAEGDVPQSLQGVTLLGLDLGMLQAGASAKGEFENRLKGVIHEIKNASTPIILFIDEAHMLVGAGGQAGTADAANLLKPALARGELRTIAATTWSEYKKYFEKDPALARRFQLVKLDEPTVETAVLILRGLRARYEQVHNVIMADAAIQAAAELSARYITGRQLPDKAVDLLDTACARVKVMQNAKPDVVEDAERLVQALQRELEGLQRDHAHQLSSDAERITSLQAQIAQQQETAQALHAAWQAQKDAAAAVHAARQALHAAQQDADTAPATRETLAQNLAQAQAALEGLQQHQAMVRLHVDSDVVAKVVSDWTGIPLGKVQRDQARSVLQLADNLKARVRGQDHAMHMIGEVIKTSASGLKDPEQPLGVFLLAGPSGVGKTETALAVADLLFGNEKSCVTVNMSEFQEKHNVSRLIGSPPGYVGYGEGGMLTEAVRQRPYTVVLLDEVEKAHLDVMNLFYQVFDKGVLSDGEGKEIDFSNTVIFLTSNLATDAITALCSATPEPQQEAITQAIRPILSAHFKPALLARMTVIPYFTLNTSALENIVRLKLKKIVQRLEKNQGITLKYGDDVVAVIASRCTEVETGARNIDLILRTQVLPLLSQNILKLQSGNNFNKVLNLEIVDGQFALQQISLPE